MNDEDAQALGFDSAKQFFSMVASVDLSTAAKRRAFKDWQDQDGTRAGLKKLLGEA